MGVARLTGGVVHPDLDTRGRGTPDECRRVGRVREKVVPNTGSRGLESSRRV